MMKLYLIRHAIAEPLRTGMTDEARPLTPRGRKRFGRVVDGLADMNIRFNRLLHSPWLRAVQTAQLLTPRVEGSTAVTPHLACAPTEALLAELTGQRVALVGHQPWLGELLGWLAFDDRRLGARMTFKKGGVAALTGDSIPGGMQFETMWSPKLFRHVT